MPRSRCGDFATTAGRETRNRQAKTVGFWIATNVGFTDAANTLHRHYPASAVVQAPPPPCRPGLTLAGSRLARATPPKGLPCCHRPPLPCVPPSLPRRSRPVRASLASRPVAASPVSRPARPPLALRSSWSLSRPGRPVAPECFSRSRYLLQPLRLLPAGATVAGRGSHPLGDGAFPRRTEQVGLVDYCKQAKLI